MELARMKATHRPHPTHKGWTLCGCQSEFITSAPDRYDCRRCLRSVLAKRKVRPC